MAITYNPSIVGANSDDLVLHLDAGSKFSIPNRTENTQQQWLDLSKYTSGDASEPHSPILASGHSYPPFSNAFGGCLLYSDGTKYQTHCINSKYFNKEIRINYTISIWFQTASSFNANDSASRGLITTGSTSSGFHFYHVHNSSFDRLYIGAHSGTVGPIGSYYDIEPSTWYNATLVLNVNAPTDLEPTVAGNQTQSDGLQIYINGNLIGNHSFNGINSDNNKFYIGGGGQWSLNSSGSLYGYGDHSKDLSIYTSSESKHDGAISSILMYYRTALTQLEVKQNFNALRGRYNI